MKISTKQPFINAPTKPEIWAAWYIHILSFLAFLREQIGVSEEKQEAN